MVEIVKKKKKIDSRNEAVFTARFKVKLTSFFNIFLHYIHKSNQKATFIQYAPQYIYRGNKSNQKLIASITTFRAIFNVRKNVNSKVTKTMSRYKTF